MSMIDGDKVAASLNDMIKAKKDERASLSVPQINEVLLEFITLVTKEYESSLRHSGHPKHDTNRMLEAYGVHLESWRVRTLLQLVRRLDEPNADSSSLQ